MTIEAGFASCIALYIDSEADVDTRTHPLVGVITDRTRRDALSSVKTLRRIAPQAAIRPKAEASGAAAMAL